MRNFSVLLTSKAAERIRQGGMWGSLTLKVSSAELVGMVSVVGHKDEVRYPVETDIAGHFLNSCDDKPVGVWYRVEAALHASWVVAVAKAGALPLDAFRDAVASGFTNLGEKVYFAMTHAPDAPQFSQDFPVPEFAMWRVSKVGVEPLHIDVEPEFVDARALAPHWPVADLESARVMVVGCGSIGGAAVRELAAAGVGRLDLVDPDRLWWRNLVRHVCGPRHVGKLKVTALKDDFAQIRPRTDVQAHDLDVVRDADRVRELLRDTDIVLCAADGISPRRVVGHLARRAGVPAVLACVLENGQFGEIMRLRPWMHHGCLQCRRQQLFDEGGMLPESLLDAEYGIGTSHRPMTAVGSDLHFIGAFAAKVTLATLLHDKGHHDQRMDAEHALVALRPRPGWAPPFDVGRAGKVRWMPATPPRDGCPTCGPA